MADLKISQLVDGGAPQATDEFVVDRAGVDNFKLDWASMQAAGAAPSGAAGGVLGGTYPNPAFAVDMATQAELDAHINDPADAHAGTAIGNTPAGSIAATTVQAAINELDTEKPATGDVVLKSLYDANTILAATADDTPAAVTMGASTILARLAAGNIKAATPAELRTLLDVPTTGEAILDAIVDAKGDLIAASAADTVARLAIGATTGHVLTVDPAETLGMKWAAATADLSAAVILLPTTDARNVIQPSAATVKALVLKGFASQSDNLLEAQNSAGTMVASITPAGVFTSSPGFSVQVGATNFLEANHVEIQSFNAKNLLLNRQGNKIGIGSHAINPTLAADLHMKASATTAIALAIDALASQTGDLTEWRDSTPSILSRINKAGYFMTRKIAAPADADIATSELAIWFDNTNLLAKAMFKGKTADGTVVTGSVALA